MIQIIRNWGHISCQAPNGKQQLKLLYSEDYKMVDESKILNVILEIYKPKSSNELRVILPNRVLPI